MRIGIDLRVLARGTRTGIEEYTINITRALVERYPDTEFRLFYNAFRAAPLDFPWLSLPNVKLVETRLPNRLLDRIGPFLRQPKIDRLLGGVEVFFSPHFFWASLARSPRVVVVHDLSFVRFPEFFSRRRLLWHHALLPTLQLRRADHLIAVSQSTKNDLVNFWRIPEKNINVVYEGVDRSLFKKFEHMDIEAYRRSRGLPDLFFLFVGTLEPRKNLLSALRAFAGLRRFGKIPGWKFIVCGSRGWLWEPIFREIKALGIASDVLFFQCEPDERPLLYGAASISLFPSYFEGFGLPVLEAMAIGTPVITSNRSSLPEVAAEAAIMIDPWRETELQNAMASAASDKALRGELIKRGFARALYFSWDKAAEDTFGVLRKVARRKPVFYR